MGQKVVVIGLDALTFDVLQPWIDAGKLPAFKALLHHGVGGSVQSTIPPVTPTSWSSFMTGKNPGKHGVYYFTARDRVSGRDVPINANLRAGKAVWDLLSEAGKKVLVLNVPTTYPPHAVNGVLIADFLTPKGSRDFIYPVALVEELEQQFGPYPLYLKTPMFSANLSEATVEAFLRELHDELAYKCQVTHYLMDKYDPDFTMLHIWGTDRIEHELWNLFDERHPRYNRVLGGKYRDRILDYFRAVDAEVQRLRNRLDAETSLLIISDHGMGPIDTCIDLNVWLLEQGYIALKPTLVSQLKFLAWRMGLTFELVFKYFLTPAFKYGWKGIDTAPADGLRLLQSGRKDPLLSFDDVDWARTKAYCRVGLGQITINVAGREPYGSVKPGPEYLAIRDAIVSKLRQLRHPATGENIDGAIYLKETTYHGAFLDQAPDITFLPLERGCVAGNFCGFATNKAITDAAFMMAHHRMDGLLMAEGKHLQQGKHIDNAQIIDLAPTLLYLLGQKIPADMDGRVLQGMFREAFLAEHPIELTAAAEPEQRQAYVMSQADEEDIISRLRDLGYL